jgi:hypothetical protein
VITAEGEEIAHIPVEGEETITLDTGTYTLEVSARGFEPAKRQVLLLEGQTKPVNFELKKTQRTVKVTSQKIPVEIFLLGGAGIILILVIYFWKR